MVCTEDGVLRTEHSLEEEVPVIQILGGGGQSDLEHGE